MVMTHELKMDGAPTYDLQQYAAQYTGPIKIHRLNSIANKCPQVKERALELCIQAIKQETLDVQAYSRVCDTLQQTNPANPLAALDSEWCTATQKKVDEWSASLNGLNNREYSEQAALFYSETGQFNDAQRSLARLSDTQGGFAQNEDLRYRMAFFGFISDSMPYVRALMNKQSLIHSAEDSSVPATANCLMYALTELKLDQFESTVGWLLNLPTGNDQVHQLNNLASTTDLGIYTALCALASLPRQDLQYLAQKDVKFSTFCEDAAYLRDLMLAFVRVDYATFFSIWNKHVVDFKADMFIGPQVDKLFELIKAKAMKQYLDVYARMDITQVAETFSITSDDVISIVKVLIATYKLDLRIDISTGVVAMSDKSGFDQVYNQSSQVARYFCKDSRILLWSAETI